MNREEIIGKLCEFIKSFYFVNIPVHEDTNLQEDLGFDELDWIQYVMEIEKFFNIRIEEDEISRLKTVSDSAKLIFNKLNYE